MTIGEVAENTGRSTFPAAVADTGTLCLRSKDSDGEKFVDLLNSVMACSFSSPGCELLGSESVFPDQCSA